MLHHLNNRTRLLGRQVPDRPRHLLDYTEMGAQRRATGRPRTLGRTFLRRLYSFCRESSF